ncbi:MAG: hypothetical protein ACYDG2_07285 [Ruminiclostridium sp.]
MRIGYESIRALQRKALEIYDDPANEFVAGFIGELPMNLNQAIIAKHASELFFTFTGGPVKIAVPKRYYAVLKEGMTIKLGISYTYHS